MLMHTLSASSNPFFNPFLWLSESFQAGNSFFETASPGVAEITPDTNLGTSTHKRGDHTVFVPTRTSKRAPSMVVMLHGAGQDPADFAAGTTMNEAAERHGFVVLYPAQPASANAYRCWNWYDPAHQGRDQGEPARIVALTRQVAAEQGVDAERIYIAGLSAGGAMASLIGELFPELFSAVGVHSGLASFAGSDLSSALASMRGTERLATTPSGMPTIVFHGDSDSTVSPVNGMHVMDAAFGAGCAYRVEDYVGPDGRHVTRRCYFDADSTAVRGEHWALRGASHAWSGGSHKGSFADVSGPDASEEMLRFFKGLEPRKGAAKRML